MIQDNRNYYCKVCGTSVVEFRKNGLLGCPNCYKTFEREIKSMLPKLHAGTKHYGKAPIRLKEKFIKEREIMYLKNCLKVALKTEKYEKAAQIRDKLRKIGGEYECKKS